MSGGLAIPSLGRPRPCSSATGWHLPRWSCACCWPSWRSATASSSTTSALGTCWWPSGCSLVVRDSTSENQRLFANTTGQGWRFSRKIEWLTGPLVGAGSARESGMSFRNDEELKRLADFFNTGGQERFTTVVFESREAIAMSWYTVAGGEPIAGMNKRK